MFGNATSHAIYANDVLQVTHINKGLEGQQPFLQAECNKMANRRNNYTRTVFINRKSSHWHINKSLKRNPVYFRKIRIITG